MKNWRTIYKCSCGQLITGGVGKWDTYFFLQEICHKCGKSKKQFQKIGQAYWKWKPTIFDWFGGEYIYLKEKSNH